MSSPGKPTLGFVGLGHMGGNMAARERAEALGHERRDLAALFQAFEQMTRNERLGPVKLPKEER